MSKQQRNAPQAPAEPDPIAALRVMDEDPEPQVGTVSAEDVTPIDDSNVVVAGDVSSPPAERMRYFCTRETYLSWGNQFITVPRDAEVHDGNYGSGAVEKMKAAGVPFREERG